MLGDGISSDRISATYENGVLTITMPVAEKAKARKVEISTGGAPAAAPVGQGDRPVLAQ
jgi:HSP20 family protein